MSTHIEEALERWMNDPKIVASLALVEVAAQQVHNEELVSLVRSLVETSFTRGAVEQMQWVTKTRREILDG